MDPVTPKRDDAAFRAAMERYMQAKKLKTQSPEVIESAKTPPQKKKHHVVVDNTVDGCKFQVVGVEYVKDHPDHDYAKMVKNDEYKGDTLMLYAENAQDFFKALIGKDNRAGGGSACIRPFLYPEGVKSNVFSMGIITGFSIRQGGFECLSPPAKMMLNLNFRMIASVIVEHNIKRVIFPCSNQDVHLFGSGIFNPAREVTQYISDKIVDIYTLPSSEKLKPFDVYKELLVNTWSQLVTLVDVCATIRPLIKDDKASPLLLEAKSRYIKTLLTGQLA